MRIDIKLKKNFENCFNKLKEEYGEEMAALNGFADTQLDYTDFIDNFVDEPVVADASIDGNANVRSKDVLTLEREMAKPHMKLLAYNKIFYELNKLHGYQVAKKWLTADWIGQLYMHDPVSSSFKPYCFSYDLGDLARRGLFFIDGFNAQPPKHLTTFVDFVGEYVSYTCNRSSGAVGLANFLVYAWYFWDKDVKSGYYLRSPEYYGRQAIQEIVYRLNQKFLRDSSQSAFTNWSIFDKPYLEALFGGLEFPDGSYAIDHIDEIKEFQMMALDVVGEIREQNMSTFPVLTYCLLRDEDGHFIDEEFAKWCCRHNMKWADSNFFISKDVTSLSNCCRLRAEIDAYFNSIGGTALEVGSIKVNTINLARIAYESKNPGDYINILKKRSLLCLQALDAVRHIIKRNVEKGLLPTYDLGMIHFENQYNTIGIIGTYETLQHFGMVEIDEFGYSHYSDEGIKFAKKIFETIHAVKDDFTKDKDYRANIEQIPGETAAVKLMEKDKYFYPDEKYELPLYGNQHIPLGVKTSIAERAKTCGVLDEALNGGSILHASIDAPFNTFDTAWDMLNYIADMGVPYFAFNTRISACENNHGFYGDTCPKCGKPKVTTYQRIVGFLVAEKTYSKERKAEFVLRDWMDLNNASKDNS